MKCVWYSFVFGLAACGPEFDPPTDERRYAVASAGMQFVARDIDRAQMVDFIDSFEVDLATDVDVVAVHQDYFGLPWDAFEHGTEPPPEWLERIDKLKAGVEAAGKPVFLTLGLAQQHTRTGPSDDAVVIDGRLTMNSYPEMRCYNFETAPDGPSKKAAFLAYVEFMMEKFDPVYLNLAPEINFAQVCLESWDAMVATYNAAYVRAKEIKPSVIAFPSFQLERLYGQDANHCAALCESCSQEQCYEVGFRMIQNMHRDRFAISVYPWWMHGRDVTADYLVGPARRGGEQVVIAETGWGTDPFVAEHGPDGSECFEVPFRFSEHDAEDYMKVIFETAKDEDIELVTYFSNRDLVPQGLMECPCTFDDAWCGMLHELQGLMTSAVGPEGAFVADAALKGFGTMGLRRYDGELKPGLDEIWRAATAAPLARSLK